MASPVLDFGAFTPTELQSMLTAAKAELLVRMNPGRVRQGGSAAQQYGMDLMTYAELVSFLNGISTALGVNNPANTVSPNFNTRQNCGPFGSTFGAGGGTSCFGP